MWKKVNGLNAFQMPCTLLDRWYLNTVCAIALSLHKPLSRFICENRVWMSVCLLLQLTRCVSDIDSRRCLTMLTCLRQPSAWPRVTWPTYHWGFRSYIFTQEHNHTSIRWDLWLCDLLLISVIGFRPKKHTLTKILEFATCFHIVQ
jgi:hypothetical protein